MLQIPSKSIANMKAQVKRFLRFFFHEKTPIYRAIRKIYHTFSPIIRSTDLQQKKTSLIDATFPLPCDVLFQVENFLGGGLENVVLDLLITFRQKGFRVALLILGEAGDAAKNAENLAIPVLMQAYTEVNYTCILKQISPHLVFSHYSTHGSNLCAQMDIPFVQVIHNAYMWFEEKEKQNFTESIQHTTVFVAVSEWVKEYSTKRLGLPENKVIVIPNGIEMGRFRHQYLREKGRELRKNLGFTDTDVLFVSIAAITTQKNSFGLVQAFHAALPDCPSAKLVMLGPIYDETLYKNITRYIQKNHLHEKIIYLGKSIEPELYYHMADLFIHAAFFEGGQLSLLEALASNLPVISTDIGFCRHFRNHRGVYLAPPPVDLLTYQETIAELTIPLGYAIVFAEYIRQAYAERVCPDLSDQLLECMDKEVSYAAYVDLISELIVSNTVSSKTYDVWTNRLTSPKQSAPSL